MKKNILFFVFISLMCGNARAFLSRGFNVEELSRRSDSIFMGEVMSVTPSSPDDKNIPYIEVTMKILEKMKGNIPSVYSYKQFAPKIGKHFELIGMNKASYVLGDKIVVFLGGPSSAGFSAPIDFQLYKLLSKSDKRQDLDKAIIVNSEFGEKVNQNLFKNLQKKKAIEVAQEILAKKQTSENAHMNFADLRKLIRASVEP